MLLQPLICEECCIQSKVTANHIRTSHLTRVGVLSESCLLRNDNNYTLKETKALSGLHLTITFNTVSSHVLMHKFVIAKIAFRLLKQTVTIYCLFHPRIHIIEINNAISF